MSWSEQIARQLDSALIRLDALCRVYAPPREREQASESLESQDQRGPMPGAGRVAGGAQ